jgi:hypothetical protein
VEGIRRQQGVVRIRQRFVVRKLHRQKVSPRVTFAGTRPLLKPVPALREHTAEIIEPRPPTWDPSGWLRRGGWFRR